MDYTISLKLTVMRLSVKDHSESLVSSLRETDPLHQLTLAGEDGGFTRTGRLWLYSALVRSILELHTRHLSDTVIILPGFRSEHVKEALEILESEDIDVIHTRNEVIKVLEVLGVRLEDYVWPLATTKELPHLQVKTETDDESCTNDIQMRLEEDFGPEDQGKKEQHDQNEGQDQNEDQVQNEDPDEDIRPSVEPVPATQIKVEADSEGGETVNKNVEEVRSPQESENEVEESSESDFELQQRKLREVEDLLLKENGVWYCNVCDYSSLKKTYVRLHAETHVSGLTFICKYCSVICTTRNNMKTHMRNVHRNGEIDSQASDNLQEKTADDAIDKLLMDSDEEDAEGNANKNDKLLEEGEQSKDIDNATADFESSVRAVKELLKGSDEPMEAEESDERVNESGGEIEKHEQKLKEVESILIRDDQGLWKCGVCGKTRENMWNMRRHVEIHVSGLSYTCKICGMVFDGKAKLHNHHSRLHREGSGKNHRKNSRSIPNKENDEIVKHGEVDNLISREQGVWKCKVCGKISDARYSLRDHVETHLTRYECRICSKVLTNKLRLSRHLRKVHGNAARTGQRKTTKYLKTKHVEQMKKNEDTDYKSLIVKETGGLLRCKACSKTYRNRPAISYHVKLHLKS